MHRDSYVSFVVNDHFHGDGKIVCWEQFHGLENGTGYYKTGTNVRDLEMFKAQ